MTITNNKSNTFLTSTVLKMSEQEHYTKNLWDKFSIRIFKRILVYSNICKYRNICMDIRVLMLFKYSNTFEQVYVFVMGLIISNSNNNHTNTSSFFNTSNAAQCGLCQYSTHSHDFNKTATINQQHLVIVRLIIYTLHTRACIHYVHGLQTNVLVF